MTHRYYAPVQLLAFSPILYLTVQKGTPSSAGPLKVWGPIWSNRPKTGPGAKPHSAMSSSSSVQTGDENFTLVTNKKNLKRKSRKNTSNSSSDDQSNAKSVKKAAAT